MKEKQNSSIVHIEVNVKPIGNNVAVIFIYNVYLDLFAQPPWGN